MNDTFIEVGHYQLCKNGEAAPGDAFLSQKHDGDGRVITVLSDGLGSGIKAGVLSTLTATMAMKFVASDIPIRRAATIIMNTLPVCRERGISYATFTLVDIEPNSSVRIMEYDNPDYVLVRQNVVVEPIKQAMPIERKSAKSAPTREAILYYSDYRARPGDRLVFFSDGVTQSGMGMRLTPLGWGAAPVQEYILEEIAKRQDVSARELARSIVTRAVQNDQYQARDDITCAVIYFRHPRDLLIMTGPPVNPDHDAEMAREFTGFNGKKILCGGTTANIVSRELGKPLKLIMKDLDPVVPPMSTMDGADLVTEGIITMGMVSEILDRSSLPGGNLLVDSDRKNAATRMVELLLDSDRITFLVGTKINEAHQDPNMPVELEIRRNVVKKIQSLLSERYLKEVSVRYI
ncbi:MAG: SpoIIE family protein phosphatase [Spirochaetales bacterium]|nr:SpoIIE family protein phosphatase [Spirochaetales bacterium]